jgi:hypothetical protein
VAYGKKLANMELSGEKVETFTSVSWVNLDTENLLVPIFPVDGDPQWRHQFGHSDPWAQELKVVRFVWNLAEMLVRTCRIVKYINLVTFRAYYWPPAPVPTYWPKILWTPWTQKLKVVRFKWNLAEMLVWKCRMATYSLGYILHLTPITSPGTDPRFHGPLGPNKWKFLD